MNTSQAVITFWGALSMAVGQEHAVRVRVYNYAEVAEGTLAKAKAEARRVLRTAEVEIEWVDCPAVRVGDGQKELGEPRYRACGEPVKPNDLFVRLIPRRMEFRPAPARGFGYVIQAASGPSDNHAYILCDRVRERALQCRISESGLLGHVMAHELSHLLLGDDAHSRHGVLMTGWGQKELVEIDSGGLSFTPQEKARLRSGAIARANGR